MLNCALETRKMASSTCHSFVAVTNVVLLIAMSAFVSWMYYICLEFCYHVFDSGSFAPLILYMCGLLYIVIYVIYHAVNEAFCYCYSVTRTEFKDNWDKYNKRTPECLCNYMYFFFMFFIIIFYIWFLVRLNEGDYDDDIVSPKEHVWALYTMCWIPFGFLPVAKIGYYLYIHTFPKHVMFQDTGTNSGTYYAV